MNKIHQKFVVPMKKEFITRTIPVPIPVPIPIENSENTQNNVISLENIRADMEEYKKLTDKRIEEIRNSLNDVISSNSLENIKGDLEEYKKITDERIEKLVNLFLSIK
jgi:hypothetical protein